MRKRHCTRVETISSSRGIRTRPQSYTDFTYARPVWYVLYGRVERKKVICDTRKGYFVLFTYALRRSAAFRSPFVFPFPSVSLNRKRTGDTAVLTVWCPQRTAATTHTRPYSLCTYYFPRSTRATELRSERFSRALYIIRNVVCTYYRSYIKDYSCRGAFNRIVLFHDDDDDNNSNNNNNNNNTFKRREMDFFIGKKRIKCKKCPTSPMFL